MMKRFKGQQGSWHVLARIGRRPLARLPLLLACREGQRGTMRFKDEGRVGEAASERAQLYAYESPQDRRRRRTFR